MHRLTDCLTKINVRKAQNIRICSDSILHLLPREELEEELLQDHEKGIEVNARTAELYSKQGNTDITEIDETTQCGNCKEHIEKEESYCTC